MMSRMSLEVWEMVSYFDWLGLYSTQLQLFMSEELQFCSYLVNENKL